MAPLGKWFGGKGKGTDMVKPDAATLARLKDKVRLILGLSEDVAISINEIICADPACPGMETVILIMAPGQKTIAAKVQASVDQVSDAALTEAVMAVVG
jgi:hypothetical protein